MAIRNSTKAILIKDNKILVNRCVMESGEEFYDLPGGGQNMYETMEEGLIREVLEETGYHIKVGRFIALTEEIEDDEQTRKDYPGLTHRMHHIFLASLENEIQDEVTEVDFYQKESLWVSIEEADRLTFHPVALSGKVKSLCTSEIPVFLGSEHVILGS